MTVIGVWEIAQRECYLPVTVCTHLTDFDLRSKHRFYYEVGPIVWQGILVGRHSVKSGTVVIIIIIVIITTHL